MKDYTQYKIDRNSFISGNGMKDEIRIGSYSYIVKYRKDSPRGPLYNHISEYLGSGVYRLLGIPVQECFLGMYAGKEVVLVKNFLKKGETFLGFENVMETLLDRNREWSSYSLDDIEHILIASGKSGSIRASIDRFWDMYIIDALNANPARGVTSWGYVEHLGEYTLAPVYNNDSCMYPEINGDASLNAVMKSPTLIEEKLFDASSEILVHESNMSFMKVIRSHEYKECDKALLRIVPRIDLNAINKLIDSIEVISKDRKAFYKVMYEERYSKILKSAYDELQYGGNLREL